jgi:hypothetical protein
MPPETVMVRSRSMSIDMMRLRGDTRVVRQRPKLQVQATRIVCRPAILSRAIYKKENEMFGLTPLRALHEAP